MRAIIVGGGIPPSRNLIEKYMINNSYIIAADSGADILSEYGITPNFLLGDFDSISKDVYERFLSNTSIVRFPKEKDYTDAQAAFNKAVDLGAEEIIFLGCTGKRIDHFMANICILNEALEMGIKAYIVDEENEIFLIDESIVLEGNPGQIFSIFSYAEDTENLTLSGVKYELNNYYLTKTDNLTVSNEFLQKEANIQFSKGKLMIIKNK